MMDNQMGGTTCGGGYRGYGLVMNALGETSFPIIPVEPVSINFIMGDVFEACIKKNST
jgi:hypothetical protein